MRKEDRHQLRKELRQAGASVAEANDLLPIAAQLGQLHEVALKQHVPRWRGTRLRPLRMIAISVAGVAIGIMLIVMAQSATPTSWLYPVQKASDGVAVTLHPQYRATVMMRRAQQVNYLVASHASTQQVLAVLSDYDHEAGAYKNMPHANYAAFEYCKLNLQQAAVAAPLHERQAILASLQPLNDI